MLKKILIVSILAGQLIKFPLIDNLGPTLLDFYILTLVLFGFIKLNFKLKKPPVFINLGFVFILIAILSLIFTPLYLTGIEYISSFLYTLRFTLILSSAWIIYSDFAELKKNISSILMFSGVGVALLGLLQFLIFPNLQFLQSVGWDPHYFRTVSTFLDPNFAGVFFVLTLILLIAQPRVFNIFFIITYLALLTTFSRSSYLMFLVSGLTLSTIKRSKMLAISILLLFALLLVSFQIYTQFIAKPRNIDREESASYRLNTWQQGLTLFRKFPLLGVGFNSYKYALRQFNLGDAQFLQSRGATSNDSSFLFILATTGIIGFTVYVLFLISLFKHSLKKDALFTSALAGLLVSSIFTNSLFYPPILYWIMIKAVDTKD